MNAVLDEVKVEKEQPDELLEQHLRKVHGVYSDRVRSILLAQPLNPIEKLEIRVLPRRNLV